MISRRASRATVRKAANDVRKVKASRALSARRQFGMRYGDAMRICAPIHLPAVRMSRARTGFR